MLQDLRQCDRKDRKIMNFKQWIFNESKTLNPSAEDGWEACKQEVLKIIFLNLKENGERTIDINKTIKEVENL